jgi:hypothetical protein
VDFRCDDATRGQIEEELATASSAGFSLANYSTEQIEVPMEK